MGKYIYIGSKPFVKQHNLNRDIQYKMTLIGPNRDDFYFLLGDKNLSIYGSQGQIRSAVLALKLSEVKLFNNITGDTPILLLDDMFSELDINKRNNILKYLDRNIQTIITTTDIKNINEKIKEKTNVYEIKEGKIIIKDVIADAFLQYTLLIPEEYSVIATLNLNGDYVSDQLAAMVGGIGIAPGANINYKSGHAIFEATHGTAPNIAGKNVVNPCSLLLSSVMMLEYMGWKEAAELIVNALEKAFSKGEATHDLARFMPNGHALGTNEFGQEIISLL